MFGANDSLDVSSNIEIAYDFDAPRIEQTH